MAVVLNGFGMGMNSSDLRCYVKGIFTTFAVFFWENLTTHSTNMLSKGLIGSLLKPQWLIMQ